MKKFMKTFGSLVLLLVFIIPSLAHAKILDALSFGVVGDGVVDDTRALQRLISSLSDGDTALLSGGAYRFTDTLIFQGKRLSLRGSGSLQTILVYDGASRSRDLMTFGERGKLSRISLKGFTVTSRVSMISGSAIHFIDIGRSDVSDVVVDGQDGNGLLWDGFWFDGVDFMLCDSFQSRAQHDAVRVNGEKEAGPKADLFLSRFKIGGSGIGLHVAGAFGGLFVEQGDIISNGINVLVDTAYIAEGNRELFFGPNLALDSSRDGPSFLLADTLANPEAFIQFSQVWVASGVADGIHVKSGVQYIIAVNGGTIFNFKGDGLNSNCSVCQIIIDGTVVRSNAGVGVRGSSVIRMETAIFRDNKGGDHLVSIPRSQLPRPRLPLR